MSERVEELARELCALWVLNMTTRGARSVDEVSRRMEATIQAAEADGIRNQVYVRANQFFHGA
jgi:uncharacterized protein with GYD domain